MGGRLKSEFVVNSNGKCFLCLNQNQSPQSQVTRPSLPVKMEPGIEPQVLRPQPSSRFSIQLLSRYLKMNRRKVFTDEKGPIPPSLLAKLERSTMKVELCENCASLNIKLSKLFVELERIKIEIGSCLQSIQNKLIKSANSDHNSDIDEDIEKEGLRNLHVLRREAADKCSLTLKSITPKIKVQKLTEKETDAWRRRPISSSKHSSEKIISKSGPHTDLAELERIKIKTEQHDEPFDVDDNADAGSDYDYEPDPEEFANSPSSPSSPVDNEVETGDVKPEIRRRLEKLPSKPVRQHYGFKIKSGKYKCRFCPKQFRGNTFLREHYLVIHTGHKYNCEKCSRPYKWKRNLRQHQSVCGKPEVPAKKICICHVCGQDFTRRRSLQIHMNTIHMQIRKHVCDECGKTFKRKGHLDVHRKLVHSGGRYKCGIAGCKISFNKKLALRRHEKGHQTTRKDSQSHSDSVDADGDMAMESEGSPIPEPDKELTIPKNHGLEISCLFCDLKFKASDIPSHLANAHLQLHQPQPNAEETQIPQDFSFVRVSKLSNSSHVEEDTPRSTVISETGKIKCSLCPEEFKVESQFERHFQNYHLSIKCNLCQKVFSHRKSYTRHHDKKHAELKQKQPTRIRLKCPNCPQTFKIKKYLQRHQRLGACKGEQRAPVGKPPKKRILCLICNEGFSGYKFLQHHHQNAHMQGL